jgi:uncharacterized protein (DUF2235 family)
MKRIIICSDGTWNDLDMRYITNVGRLVQSLLATGKSGNKRIPQLIYYDDGVGADASGIQRYIQGGVGLGIDNLIYNAYRFLCINYEEGDEVCLFGFSRGAFTVRSVAGMVGCVGLVPRSELKYLPDALDAYRSKKPEQQTKFKKTAKCRDIKITLLGCWDTVGALGIPDKIPFLPIDNMLRKKYEFHNTDLGKHVERALHAVAIDERRKEFNVTLMNKQKGAPASQKLTQRWFPGDHGCVGGGTWEKRGLSNRCLKWMVEEAANLGVQLGVDFKRLHDNAINDPCVFFQGNTSLIYGKLDRKIPANTTRWEDLDHTAHQRWAEHADYRPPSLKKFSTELNNVPSVGVRTVPGSLTALKTGQSAYCRVFSRSKDNRSNIQVEKGQSYQLEISRLQVWKDGDLDPCDILGWNTNKPELKTSKLPYEDGKPADLGTLTTNVIRMGKKKKLVKTADWFELVMSIGEDDYHRLNIKKPGDEITPYTISFSAAKTGELYFTANDLASSISFIDKYDNNAGWVWVKVKQVM